MSAAPVLPFRTMLWNQDAEDAILAGMLMDAGAVASAQNGTVREAHFYSDKHKRIFRAMLAVAARGSAVDPLTLSEELSRRGDLDAVGGKDFIGYLIGAIPTAVNFEHHAGLVVEKYEQRESLALLEQATGLIRDGIKPRDVRRQLDDVLDTIMPPTVGRDALQLYDDVEIERLPDAVPIVQDTLYEDSVAALYGPYATLKTFIALDIALCIGTGFPWHGRQVRKGAVVYVYAEGRGGIKKRVQAWKEANHHVGRAGVYFVPTSVRFTDPSEVAKFLRLVERRVKGQRITAVVIDTVARNMDGDESKVEDMNRFVAGCDAVREATGATVIAVHHTGWAATDRMRGSTSLPGAVNTELLVERDDYVLTVTCKKQKDGIEDAANITLEAYPIAGSLALRAVAVNRPELSRNECKALDLLPSDDGMTATEWKEAVGIPERSFMRARKRLVDLRYVNLKKKRYARTDAGNLALTANCHSTAKLLPTHSTPLTATRSLPLRESVAVGEVSGR